jgi:c-di-GMP-binding flagellar brake protein YcgR
MKFERSMERLKDTTERRKYPRIVLDLPLEYRVVNIPNAHPNARGALVVNMSEMGLLIESGKDIPVGTKLIIIVLFLKGFELANFKVLADVAWKEIHWKEDWEGYRYGLKFISIGAHDYWKLIQLLHGRFKFEDISISL